MWSLKDTAELRNAVPITQVLPDTNAFNASNATTEESGSSSSLPALNYWALLLLLLCVVVVFGNMLVILSVSR